MLSVFALVQLLVNALLIAAVLVLFRAREAGARAAREREERLESLAGDLCRLGQQVVGAAERQAPPPAPRPEVPAARLAVAASLLEGGAPVGAVAARTAMLEGELMVLQNLRRPPAAGKAPRAPRRAPAARRAATPPAALRGEA